MIERRPRAPVLRSMALRAMAPSVSSTSVRSIDSISNSRWYCFTSAFLGWVRISFSEGSSRSSSVDAALGPLDIIVGRLQQLEDDVLDVLADIASCGESWRIGHGERHIENARQRLRQQRLSGAGRTDQQDVGLGEFYVVVLGVMVEPLVVIVHRDREHLLGVI